MPRRDGPYATLGHVVRDLRKARGWTQEEMAVQPKADLSNTQISKIETGQNVEIELYDRCAKALGFRSLLEMFRSGGDPETRKLLRLWKSLGSPDDPETKEARTHALGQIQTIADKMRE